MTLAPCSPRCLPTAGPAAKAPNSTTRRSLSVWTAALIAPPRAGRRARPGCVHPAGGRDGAGGWAPRRTGTRPADGGGSHPAFVHPGHELLVGVTSGGAAVDGEGHVAVAAKPNVAQPDTVNVAAREERARPCGVLSKHLPEVRRLDQHRHDRGLN